MDEYLRLLGRVTLQAQNTYKEIRMNPLPGQMELATVIDHRLEPVTYCNIMNTPDGLPERIHVRGVEDSYKPSGIRLAKMLSKYDDSPSSQLWSDIQRLAREILK